MSFEDVDFEYDFEHPVDTIADLMTEPQFLVDRCIALGGLEAEGELVEHNEYLEVVTTRKIEHHAPGFIAKITGSVHSIRISERWRDQGDHWSGSWDVKVLGQPARLHGDFALLPTATGCSYRATQFAEVKFPLIARKVEQYLEGMFTELLSADLDFIKEHLDEQ